jgi:hypothetical protein
MESSIGRIKKFIKETGRTGGNMVKGSIFKRMEVKE